IIGHGTEVTGGRELSSILGSTLEALVGAIYLDQGWTVAKEVVERLLAPELDSASAHQNHKGALQELTQARYQVVPEYRVQDVAGPVHQRQFAVEVWIKERCYGRGVAGSKKEAGQIAAAAALQALEDSATSSS
ncbi:MAG: ribonuclease III, partial [Armatimonadetes bacterium]|nr:ribonuclease III [Armatimonadota bacterium]